MKLSCFPLQTSRKKSDFSWLLFLLSVALSVITTYYVCAHYIDSDTSSELILAKHWIDTQTPLSSDWLYGSELRLFHVQLVYVPLMLLLDDWLMVRFIGALIMQAIYIVSFGCMVHAAGKSRRFFFHGAALLLLPVSVAYGRIVLYHNHYLPNITISFFILALSMHFTKTVNWRTGKTWLHLILLAALSFAGGMNSIRQLLITHVPLLLIIFVLCWVEDEKNKDCSKTAFLKPCNLNLLLCGFYSSFFSLAGLKAQGLLCEKLGIQIGIQSENNTLQLMESNFIDDVLYAFFHQFGFRNYVPMLSISGILSLGGIFIGCYLLVISLNRLLRGSSDRQKHTEILSLFFLAHVTVLAVVFILTSGKDSPYYYPLYLSLCFPWTVPLILCILEELPKGYHLLRAEKLFALVSVILLLLSSAANLSYFQGSDRFPQAYEGLRFQERDKKADLEDITAFLTENGYDKGYADHWESNIVTEMTDGKLPFVVIDYTIYHDSGSSNLYYADYLYSQWLKEAPCEKSFLLIPEEDIRYFQNSDSGAYCTLVYSGDKHVAYSIDDLDGFTATLHY